MAKLSYTSLGAGEPLVLIHGWGVSPRRAWRDLAPLLAQHFRVIIVELPGVGDSPAPPRDMPYYQACALALEDMRAELAVERFNILGYSIGARAAEAYMQRHPERVTSGVFINAAQMRLWISSLIKWAREIDVHHHTLAQWITTGWREAALRRALEANGRRLGYTYIWAPDDGKYDFDCLKRSLYELPGSGRAHFSLPPIPILFIWSRYDPVMHCTRVLKSRSVWVRSNHDAPMLAPKEVADKIVQFLGAGTGGEHRVISPASPRQVTSYGQPRVER